MPIATTITLPCTARELESKLHAFCDHYGFDGKVEVEGNTLIITESDSVSQQQSAFDRR